MQLVDENGALRITGAGSERAQIAYARLQNGQLTYSFDSQRAKH